jgi:hypothetical protein
LFPTLEGDAFRQGHSFFIEGNPLPEKWTQSDWHRVEVGTKIEFTCHVSWRLSGIVSEVSWDTWGGRVPFFRVMDGEFQGDPKELEKGSLRGYGSFEVLTYADATVEPCWLFPKGVVIPWKVYQSVLAYLDGWEPFRQLSLSEIWQCVKYAVDCRISWSFENLLSALSVEGNFALPWELRRTHDALKLASKLKECGWPLEDEEESLEPEEPEILNLWFDLGSQRWLWLRPDSLFEDKLGLSCAQLTKEELEQDVAFLALRLLFPVKEPFFSLKGQVFESTSGPF